VSEFKVENLPRETFGGRSGENEGGYEIS